MGRGQGKRRAEVPMTTAAALLERARPLPSLALLDGVSSGDEADAFAGVVVHVVALAGTPVDPALIAPAALVLRDEHLVELSAVSFGCNYDLDVRSFELERGYVRAVDAGWLKLRRGEVSPRPGYKTELDAPAAGRARELFALGRKELTCLARHHLLRDAEDRPDQAA
jgi:hypothetical protein